MAKTFLELRHGYVITSHNFMWILLFINAIISLGGQLIVPSKIESMNDILRGRVLVLKGTELNI